MDRAVVHECARRLLLAAGGRRLSSRHRTWGAVAAAHVADRIADADLQRGTRAHHGGIAGNLGIAASNRGRRSVRSVHPERHHRSADLDRRGSRLPRTARAHRRIWVRILSPAFEECRTQVGQHRGLGDPFRRRLCAVPDPRCGQLDDRRDIVTAGRRDGAASRCRADPDAADHHRRDDAVRARAAVRRPRVRPVDRAWHCVVARRRGQLLGPQRDDPHQCLRRTGRAAGTVRAQAVRRADNEPRLRRGRADAARRLGGAHGARRARQLRRGAADADRPRRARPSLVPRQSAAHGRPADARVLPRSAGCTC